MAIKCIKQLKRNDLTDNYEKYVKSGMSEYDAGIKVAAEYHRELFDEVADFRATVLGEDAAQAKAKYVPFDSTGIDKKYKTIASERQAEQARVVAEQAKAKADAEAKAEAARIKAETPKIKIEQKPKVESTTLKSEPEVKTETKPKIPIRQKPLTQIEAKGTKVYNKVEFAPKATVKESLIVEPEKATADTDKRVQDALAVRQKRTDDWPVLVVEKDTGKPVREIKQSQVAKLNTEKYEPRNLGGGAYTPVDFTKDDGWVDNANQRTATSTTTYTDTVTGRTGTLETMPNGTQRIRLREAKVGNPMDGTTAMSARWKPTSEPMESARNSVKTDTPEFKKWFKDSKVVDENGKPKVLYHGTTHDFDTFDPSRGNIEGHFGKVIYLTDSPTDLSENYAGEGPDLTQRIEIRAERLLDEKDLQYGTPEYKKAQAEAREAAKKEIAGTSEGLSMPVYVKMENPLDLTDDNPTRFDALGQYDEETDEYTENQDGLPMKLYDGLQEIETYGEYSDFDAQKVWDDISDKIGGDWDGVKVSDVDAIMRASEGLIYATDEDGNLAGNDIISTVYADGMGFDGIIIDADKQFGAQRQSGKAMKMDSGTKHYHVFQPNQIKSAIGNNGNFDETNPSIMERSREEMEASKESFEAAKKLPIEELLAIADPKKITHEDGVIDMADVAEYELVRRVMGNAFGKTGMAAVFQEPSVAQKFIETARDLATQANEAGVDGTKFTELANIVEDATKAANGTAIFYIDESDLGEEKAHRSLYMLRKGDRPTQVPKSDLDTFVAEPIVQKALSGKFGKLYKNKSKAAQMEEFAVKAARGQWGDLDITSEGDKRAAAQVAINYLAKFAETNAKEGQTKDQLLKQLAQEIVYGEEARDIQETYESESRPSVQSTENLNKQVADGGQGKTVSGEQYEPSGETRLSQTPISAREKANIPLKDEQYVSASNAEQQEFADRQLAKGADSAMDWFKSQVADNNLNNGATGVVGLNLANHYGMQGDYAKMNEVAELLVPAITEAAQSVQAMRVLSKFDPKMALTYAATRKMKATNKPLTDRETRRLNPKIEKLANAENDKNVTQNAVENLKQGIANADSVSQGLQTALNDATKATTADPTTVRKQVEASRKQSRPRPKKADRAEIEARIRAAFVTEVMESARGTDQTETPNFKRWFKDSKVVNGKGEPLITFRGESEERQILEGGAFFTDSPKDASAYAELAALTQAVENNEELSEIVNDILTEEGGEALTDLGPKTIRDIAGANGIDLPKTDGYIYQTYLRMENPLDLTEFGSDVGDVADLWDKLHNKGLLDEAWSSLDEDVQQEVEQDYDRMALYRFLEAEGIQAKAFEKGFDGVIFTDMSPDGGKTHTTWLVKDPLTQVKSAIGNNGNFDPQRQEIMESAREDFGNDKYQDLIDLIALDILDYKTPAETYNHIQLLTGEAITPEQFVELQLDGWRASKAEKDFTPTENLTAEQREAREERIARRTARLAHQRMAFGTQGKKAGPQKPNIFDREIREQGIDRGYSDIEIVGAILMPKLSGTKATEDWYKQMKAAYPDTDVDTFARSYELRQSVLENVQEQRMLARAEKAGYEKDLPKFENELKHRNRLVREGQTDLDNEYRKLQRGWRDVALTGAAEAMGLFKGLTSWGEISYILRQGFIPLLTDTRAALKGDWQGVGHGLQGDNALWKWAAEKGGFEDVAQYLNDHSLSMFVEKIRQHPRFLEAQNNGVRFTQIGDFNIADDHFSTKMLEWIPMYKRAEVAYTLPGDLQRLFIYDSWAKGLDELGLTKEELKKAKKYATETANAFTGKGDIAKVLARGGTLSKLANITWFSPQLLISRFQSAYRLSTGFATAPKGMKFQMAKKGLRFYGAIGVLMYLAGAVLDPEDDDFGKVNIKKDSWLASKIPDARDFHIDMLSGLDLPIQNGLRLMFGVGKSVYNQDIAYAGDAKDAIWNEMVANKSGEARLFRSKLSPGASLLVDIGKGTDFLGRPTTAWGAFTSRALPLAWQQTYDALLYDRLQSMQREPQTFENAKMKLSNEQKYDNALLMMLGTFVGVGITQYPKDDPSKAMQLTRQLSTATSSKDAETKRTEGGLRNLYKAQQEALRANEPVERINREIQSYMNKYPALRKEQNDLLSQAKSQTGLFSYYAKDVSLDGLLRIRKVAEGAELEVVNKLIKAAEKKKR